MQVAAGDKIRDLLEEGTPARPGRPLDIKHGPTGTFLPGLTEKQAGPLVCWTKLLLSHGQALGTCRSGIHRSGYTALLTSSGGRV